MISHTTSVYSQDIILPPITYTTERNTTTTISMDNTKPGDSAQPAASPRRRSSGPSYEGLMNSKRSSDPNSMARRASLHDQKPQAGFWGTMWQTFTRGPSSPSK